MTRRTAAAAALVGATAILAASAAAGAPRVIVGEAGQLAVSAAPFAVSAAPFAVSAAPFAVSAAPFAVSAAPFAVSAAPFAVSPAPLTVSATSPRARDCIADGAPRGCHAPAAGSLRGASSLALSPDGRSLYVSAYGADTLMAFARDEAGTLRFAGCSGAAAGCAAVPAGALAGTAGVAVSPGGGDVYVAAGLGRSLTRFSRSPTGELTFGACTANGGLRGCKDPRHDALAGASAVAVGPGGEDVYVTASDSAAVSHFERAADGSLQLADCVADGGNFGCARTPRNVLEGAAAIAVAPGGREVYVTSLRSGSLTRFTRTKSGALRYRSCIADGGANGCRKTTASLTAAAGLAISPDGRPVLVAAQTGVVSAYDRDLRRTARVRRASLAGATGIVTNGTDVYVAAQQADAITHLTRNLSFKDCRAARRANGCAAGPNRPLEGVYALALRGRTLYAAAPVTAALSTFAPG